jgi:hypothetical protein
MLGGQPCPESLMFRGTAGFTEAARRPCLIPILVSLQEADEDGSGELDIEEFTQKLGPHLGQHLSEAQIAQLFLKIDADCGGTIDWTEFTNYFFLQRGVTNAGEDQQRFCLYPKARRSTAWRQPAGIRAVLYLPSALWEGWEGQRLACCESNIQLRRLWLVCRSAMLCYVAAT